MLAFQQRLIEQEKKLFDINDDIHHPPEHCSAYALQYDFGGTSRDMIENLKQFTKEDSERRFIINRDIILGNNKIPPGNDIGCESSPIAQKNMNEFANQHLLQCRMNTVKNSVCKEEKTQQAYKIYVDKFYEPNYRRPFLLR